MITRRNIREKVMQTLYTIETSNDSTSPQSILDNKILQTTNSFTAALLFIVQVAKYAEIDANNRATKFIPTEADKNVSTKISGNKYLWQLLENETFSEKVKAQNIDTFINHEWVKKIYKKLINTERYKSYIAENDRNDDTERKMLNYIWKSVAAKDKIFQELLEDEWHGYEEDRRLVRTMVDFYFKAPDEFNFLDFLPKESESFADDLLRIVAEKKEYINPIIVDKLKNWDRERVALIDMILLEMGVAEFLYFPTIPTKVTINEYIEIAKEYSTEDSGRFVNGILDSIVKELVDKKQMEEKKC